MSEVFVVPDLATAIENGFAEVGNQVTDMFFAWTHTSDNSVINACCALGAAAVGIEPAMLANRPVGTTLHDLQERRLVRVVLARIYNMQQIITLDIIRDEIGGALELESAIMTWNDSCEWDIARIVTHLRNLAKQGRVDLEPRPEFRNRKFNLNG